MRRLEAFVKPHLTFCFVLCLRVHVWALLQQLDLEDQDQIDCMLEQQGGR